MDPVITSVLAKAASAAGAPVAQLIGRATVRWKVAWTVARQARKEGVKIRQRSLRKWMARPDVQDQLRLGDSATIDTAVGSLAVVLGGADQADLANAEKVLLLVFSAFLRAQEPSIATAVAYEWQAGQVRADGGATREAIKESERSILGHLSKSSAFDDNVRTLQPWRRDRAIELRESWQMIEQVVQAISSAGNRGDLFRQWDACKPDWFAAAPADAVSWLAELASDYGQSAAAIEFYKIALDRGIFPVGYWQARLAICMGIETANAKSILEQNGDRHPLARGLLAIVEEDWESAKRCLFNWDVRSHQDTVMRLQLLARLEVRAGNMNLGIKLASEAAEIEGAAGIAILTAEFLLSRAHFGRAVSKLSDCEKAAAFAVKARNARRTWRGDSVEAVLVAVKAVVLSGDYGRAFSLIDIAPLGEATEDEAKDPRLRREAAELYATVGRYDRARELLAELNDSFVKAEVDAIELMDSGNEAEATAAWNVALEAASTPSERLVAVRALAELGARLPDLSEFEDINPDMVQEIRIVQQTMSSGAGTLEALRAAAGQSLSLTVKLSERYVDDGLPEMAAAVLKSGAERWHDPQLMAMAAGHFKSAEDITAATQTAEMALTMGGSAWAGQFKTRALLFEIHTQAGSWDQAIQQARVLVSLDPNSLEARWALVHALIRRGDFEGAWGALTPEGEPAPPRDRHDALTWISLMERFDNSTQIVPRALATMSRWPDDEQLLGVFIAQIYSGLRRQNLSPTADDLAALHSATADYTQRFPDSAVFRAVPISAEDPLAALAPELQSRFESLSDVSEKVESGRLPLGILAVATGCSYAETSLRRAAGFVRCHNPTQAGRGLAAVSNALDGTVVLDTTAAHTLVLLDSETRSLLLGSFGNIHSTDAAYRDALRGEEALGLRSTVFTVWDPVAGKPRVSAVEQGLVDGLAEQASQLCRLLRGLNRRPWQDLKRFDDEGGARLEWLTPLDMAATEGIPFWCDDAVLRSAGISMGVPVFSTIDILRHLRARDRITKEFLATIEAILIYNFYVDLEFDRPTFDLAAALDQWKPGGAAFAITRPSAWVHPGNVVDFVLTALNVCADAGLEGIEAWVSAACKGLVRIAPDEGAIGMNVRIFLGQCLAQPMMRPDRLPVVLKAIRASIKDKPSVIDPLEPVLRDTYQSLVSTYGYPLAASLVMALVEYSGDEDKSIASRVILTHQV